METTRRTGDPVRWGIAATGSMAQTFVKDFEHVADAVPVAVGSRDLGRAQQFARRFGLPNAHGSYAELCADPDVDVVYVATPHPQHRAIALDAIAHGKAVLVEKAFAATLDGAREIVEAARAAQVFCMEAMWTRFHPVVRHLHELVDAGRLGEVVALQGDLFAYRPYDESHRLFAPELGGGALLDLGVYPLAFAHDFLGMPDHLLATGEMFPNGVDAQTSLALTWRSGAVASLACGLRAGGPARMAVVGTKGWVEVTSQFHHSSSLQVHREGVAPSTVTLPLVGSGYAHEIEEVTRCVQQGRLESDIMPLAATLEVQAMLQDASDQLGLHHVDDEVVG